MIADPNISTICCSQCPEFNLKIARNTKNRNVRWTVKGKKRTIIEIKLEMRTIIEIKLEMTPTLGLVDKDFKVAITNTFKELKEKCL